MGDYADFHSLLSCDYFDYHLCPHPRQFLLSNLFQLLSFLLLPYNLSHRRLLFFRYSIYTEVVFTNPHPFYLPVTSSCILPVRPTSSCSHSHHCLLSFFDCIGLILSLPLAFCLYPFYPLTSVCPSLSLSLSLYPIYILADIAV